MYNFSMLGNCMSFNTKVLKHIEQNNPERVKDYVCAAYDTFNPDHFKDHPCFEILKDANKYLRSKGWKVAMGNWKSIGNQIIIISPDGRYYHSKFQH